MTYSYCSTLASRNKLSAVGNSRNKTSFKRMLNPYIGLRPRFPIEADIFQQRTIFLPILGTSFLARRHWQPFSSNEFMLLLSDRYLSLHPTFLLTKNTGKGIRKLSFVLVGYCKNSRKTPIQVVHSVGSLPMQWPGHSDKHYATRSAMQDRKLN